MNEKRHEDPAVCNPEILKVRIDAVSQAQQRSRAAFLVSTIVAVAIAGTTWNAYLSWYRSFLFMGSLANNAVTQEAQRTFIDEWVRSLKVSIPLVGINVGIGDAAVLGSASLYIICIWLYFCMRRENHTVGLLLRETKTCNYDINNMVFHGVISYAIFTTATEFDDPIRDLETDRRRSKSSTRWLVRSTYKLLIFLPAITIITIVVMDFISITMLWSPLRDPNNQPLWRILTGDQWVKRSLMEAAAFGLFCLTAVLCGRINNYNDSTETLLRDYQKNYLEPHWRAVRDG